MEKKVFLLVVVVVFLSACATVPMGKYGNSAPLGMVAVKHPVELKKQSMMTVSIVETFTFPPLLERELEEGGGIWPAVAEGEGSKVAVGYMAQANGRQLIAFPGRIGQAEVSILDMFGNTRFGLDGKVSDKGTVAAAKEISLAEYKTVLAGILPNDFKVVNRQRGKSGEAVVYSTWLSKAKFEELASGPDRASWSEQVIDNWGFGLSLNPVSVVLGNFIRTVGALGKADERVGKNNERYAPKDRDWKSVVKTETPTF